jgi:hypothetical protein
MARLFALLFSLCTPFSALAATPEEDVQRYIGIFQAGADSDRAADDLAWMGISDTRLYDLIERQLLVDSRGTSRPERNHAARLIKALGFSGQPKYEATLNGLSEAYRRPVERALINLKLYEKWNPVIASRAGWDAKYPDDVNRVRNMLKSDDLRLQAVGAKRVFFAHSSETVLLDLLAERLRACYKTATDPDGVEAAGWMVNGLGKSASPDHRGVIAEVAAGAASDKLRSRAERTLHR